MLARGEPGNGGRSMRRAITASPGLSATKMPAKNWLVTAAQTTGPSFSTKAFGAVSLPSMRPMTPAPSRSLRLMNSLPLPS